MNIEVIRYRLPVYWACALINDDYTGLCKEECQEIKNFLNIADGYPVDVDWRAVAITIRFTGETSKMSWAALPVEPACMGKAVGEAGRPPMFVGLAE